MLMTAPLPALAQAPTLSPQPPASKGLDLSVAPESAVPSHGTAPTAVGTSPNLSDAAKRQAARIDALRFRSVVTTPSVADTVLGNIGDIRSTLASYGFGLNDALTGSFAVNTLHQPQQTYGTHRYIGQTPEFDTANNYVALTFDLGRIGLTGGLATLQGCGAASTAATYPHGIRLCGAYVDQPLLNKHLDIQAGIIPMNYQYANPFVGGSLSSGVLGPSASLLSELGLAANGIGAPAVNITVSGGHFYDRIGVQRSEFVNSLSYDEQVANPYGIRFNNAGNNLLIINEVGYRNLAAAGRYNTWIRLGGMGNTSEYTRFDGGKQRAAGMYALADQQLWQADPGQPRRGVYVGASYMYASPTVFSYSSYAEARTYAVGIIPSRPTDQVSFVANVTTVSQAYQNSLIQKGYGTTDGVYNFTLTYTYHVGPGIYFTGGLDYAVHPSPYKDNAQGNPLLVRGVLVVYL